MSLFVVLTSETKELTQRENKKNLFLEEVYIISGETAPISGIIVPEYNYKEYQKAFDFRYINQRDQKYQDLLKEVKCEDECPKPSNAIYYSIPIAFLSGAILALIAK